MRKYEVMVIIDSDVDERQVPGLVDKYLDVITKGGGTVENNDLWGRRRLAYDINKKSEGIYAVLRITSEPAAVQEMERLMGISEQIVRTKVLRIQEPKASKLKEDAKAAKAAEAKATKIAEAKAAKSED